MGGWPKEGQSRRGNNMILSDGTMRQLIEKGDILIDPFEPENVQPASLDIRLGETFLEFLPTAGCCVADPFNGILPAMKMVRSDAYYLPAGGFVLGTTLEKLQLPNNVVARIEGKSSLGRLGLLIHATAGFVDPGWSLAPLTLELSNVSPLPIILRPDMPIAQLSFILMDHPCEVPYGAERLRSRYLGQVGPTASRYGLGRL
jgi:dCTP deaminase